MSRKSGLCARLDHTLLALSLLVAFSAMAANQKAWGQTASSNLLKDPIKTNLGYVSGMTVGEAGKEVHVYRGIPYGAPPVGELRWRPPQPAAPWQGVRKATEYGPVAAQYYRPDLRKVDADESKMSEDCLYLNVNTAAKTAGDKLPVIVWFHAGGLDTGTANTEMYNNPALPQHGVVVVTVNHRLGAFGLLTVADLSAESPHNASGNYEMFDLILALRWVKQNIAAFGGDPDRITIAGQGGGGQKVMWLLCSPLAKGLFQRAIVESGTNRSFSDNNTRIDTEWQAYGVSQKFVDKMKATTIAQLRNKTWQQVVDAMPPPPAGTETTPAKDARMHGTIDAWSLADDTINILDESLGSDVPVLVGADQSEVGVFAGLVEDWLPAISHRKNNVYVYQFTHVPANWKKAGATAPHGLEVRYQFGDLSGNWNVQPGLPADPGLNKDDEVVADNTMRMWANFAATGDPSVKGVVDWPVFKPVPGQDKWVSIDIKTESHTGFMEAFKLGN
jgi:para-nitrobenzyl esterase